MPFSFFGCHKWKTYSIFISLVLACVGSLVCGHSGGKVEMFGCDKVKFGHRERISPSPWQSCTDREWDPSWCLPLMVTNSSWLVKGKKRWGTRIEFPIMVDLPISLTLYDIHKNHVLWNMTSFSWGSWYVYWSLSSVSYVEYSFSKPYKLSIWVYRPISWYEPREIVICSIFHNFKKIAMLLDSMQRSMNYQWMPADKVSHGNATKKLRGCRVKAKAIDRRPRSSDLTN